ncbi:MAG TPA: ribonuclease R [Deltaproteobacteria bacterium]|nr:MAG: ribonuclease R [Deltaproteobacteria bacterium GWA2_55_82]OGQ62596.1 MAG: ribonuclease R [Deltaproteobacteria bacterium RIFCSPLOWO2_02_FULL_55_12]OIJ74185.1 MAG: ribonuclease R [Deltaproteobacteria bacterium GWC2_55_46]HBG46807.1 ribonuclease R [Deltaproteobacteria bacterium]HCY11184.1 ribonuclease R [Deltaproteobacteria bacterium]
MSPDRPVREEELKKKVLAFMEGEAPGPLTFRELVHAFGVARDGRDSFRRAVKAMVADGLLIKTRGGKYGLPAKMNLVNGELVCHPDGYGFVVPEGRKGREGDIFISNRRLAGAMHGDTVVARVDGIKSGGRREGSIIRIVARARKTIVGRFELGRGFGVVIPSDQRLINEFIIPPKEAKGVEAGKIVSVEITSWPARNMAGTGRVLEVLGDPDDPDVEADVILRKYGLPNRFPADVMAEVGPVPAVVTEEELGGRLDLRERTTFTIDGETAKDFDDAVSIEKTPRGYRLWVSIADVGYYVKEGSAIDREAYARGTSVYFPDRAIPMLPEALSNGICSLNPKVDRLTMTAEIEFDSAGNPVKKRFYESVIRSVERMTYTNVKKLIMDEDPVLAGRYARILPDLKLMAELAGKLMKRRSEEGSIDFDLPEPQIIIDIEGRVEDIVRSERNIAHRLIEEFMLSANRAVAEEFSSRALPFIYRIHDEPSEDSIADFKDFAGSFGLRFEYDGPKSFQSVLKKAEGRPEEKLINHVLLRSMRQAVYSEENVGHFGLAFEDYTHFTSPIRRYPDLVVHRLLKLLLKKRYSPEVRDTMEAALPEVASHTSARERKAMEAEREIADLKKCQFMKDKVGEVYEGLISGVTSFGFFVELKDYFVEGLVHVSMLSDDYYIFDEKRHTLTGERTRKVYRLADEVRVKVNGVDLERRRVDLALDVKEPAKARKKGRR